MRSHPCQDIHPTATKPPRLEAYDRGWWVVVRPKARQLLIWGQKVVWDVDPSDRKWTLSCVTMPHISVSIISSCGPIVIFPFLTNFDILTETSEAEAGTAWAFFTISWFLFIITRNKHLHHKIVKQRTFWWFFIPKKFFGGFFNYSFLKSLNYLVIPCKQ